MQTTLLSESDAFFIFTRRKKIGTIGEVGTGRKGNGNVAGGIPVTGANWLVFFLEDFFGEQLSNGTCSGLINVHVCEMYFG
jgi:hypothetical protein